MADPLHLLRDLDRVPRGVIHVGANIGQEFPAYRAAGLAWGLYIEALPSVYERLRLTLEDAPNHLPINALCADVDGEERFSMSLRMMAIHRACWNSAGM